MAKAKSSQEKNAENESSPVANEDRMLKFFECGHLPPNLKEIADVFREAAVRLDVEVANGPERSAGFRKLLEAKDCFVRARLHPGG